MDTFKKNHLVHFIGIGGCGMSAIAKIMTNRGYRVSGSDIKETINTIRLRDEGIKVLIGHDAEHIRNVDVVVITTALREDNVELLEAIKQKITIKKRAEALSWLMDQSEVKIAISGTHGKTTTTSMLAALMQGNKLHPTFSVGGDVNEYNTNAKSGEGRFFITEADESDGSILYLNPSILVVTNIEEDHLEHLGNLENIENLFWKVIEKLPDNGILVINNDNNSCKKIIQKVKDQKKNFKLITYGYTSEADYFLSEMSLDHYSSKGQINHGSKIVGIIELNVPGIHNLENACAVVALTEALGIGFPQAQASLKAFLGARRRFQLVGKEQGITVIDDYAHHPSEILATLAAAKNGFKTRVVCVFQPHRYTRTMFFAEAFGQAFKDADIIIITDVYSAGESPIQGVSGESIVQKMPEGTKVIYVPKKEKIVDEAMEILQDGDLFITMGAGDVHTVAKETLMRLKK